MSGSNLTLAAPVNASRRLFLSGLGKSTLSATAVGLIVRCESLAGNMSAGRMADPEQDAAILNVALTMTGYVRPQSSLSGTFSRPDLHHRRFRLSMSRRWPRFTTGQRASSGTKGPRPID